MSRSNRSTILLLSLMVVLGCRGDRQLAAGRIEAAAPRRSTVWIGPEGLDESTSTLLRRAGVDGVVLRRGTVDLSSEVPTLRLQAAPRIAGSLPVGVALYVEAIGPEVGSESAQVLWRALAPVVGESMGAEILLDFPVMRPGLGTFLESLSNVSGLPVVPVLTVDQLGAPGALEAVKAARSCVVLVYGGVGIIRSGANPSNDNLDEQLAPLAASGARVRVGIVLEPETEPALSRWGDDLSLLAASENAEIASKSSLDRTFVVRRPLSWSSRRWNVGERISIGWTDAARLDQAFRQITRLVLPELGGWDLISLPPPGEALGIGREALLYYLDGEGPAPKVDVTIHRQGRVVRVRLVNTGPFSTAVAGVGNWVEVSVDDGSVSAESPGGFDGLELGFRSGSGWRRGGGAGFNGVRFVENYVGPRESIESGPVQLLSSRSRVTVRWQLVLTTGQQFGGVVQ
ncbi:MAG: hypothetical protein GY906_33840 [bacterium]|nr:hypothetical protein [bacterium]